MDILDVVFSPLVTMGLGMVFSLIVPLFVIGVVVVIVIMVVRKKNPPAQQPVANPQPAPVQQPVASNQAAPTTQNTTEQK